MPLTPLHMGPGILLKALLGGSFSLMVFGYANVLIDLQPLIALTSGRGETHGWTHTWLAAILIGALAAVSGKWLVDLALRVFTPPGQHALRVSWRVSTFSAFLGTFSHIALDSLMHTDMHPFWPWSDAQPWSGSATTRSVYLFCLLAGALGTMLYLAGLWFRRRKRDR